MAEKTTKLLRIEGYLGRKEAELIRKISEGAGDNQLVFLDTGAVIDFERYFERRRLVEPNYRPRDFYGKFLEAGMKLVVTPGMLGEISRHHEQHSINGRREISGETIGIIFRDMGNLVHILQHGQHKGKSIDEIEYDVYWATRLAFQEDYKKGCKDCISDEDKELLTSALWATGLEVNGKEVTGVTIISPDSHISRSIYVLTDQSPDFKEKYEELYGEFKYQNVKVISSR